MLIQVNYTDNRFDYVKDSRLHDLIESGEIARFRRSAGWVTVGVDSLRQTNRTSESKPLEVESKIVRVAYTDNRFDYVTDETLDNLIRSKTIAKFERKSGWVTVGLDPVRQSKRTHYKKDQNELLKRAL